MAITTTSFVPDPSTGQMIPGSDAAANVDRNDTSRGPVSIGVPPASAGMDSGAGRGRVVIKKGR